MNAKTYAQRTAILQQMAGLHTMEDGSLKAEYRTGPSGTNSGPYFKHQVWREGADVSQRISAEDAGTIGEAIANRQKFQALAAGFVGLTVADTRQNYRPEGFKKDFIYLLAQEEKIAALMTRFSAATPTGSAVQQLEVLIRAAVFKPAAALIGVLLQEAVDRISDPLMRLARYFDKKPSAAGWPRRVRPGC